MITRHLSERRHVPASPQAVYEAVTGLSKMAARSDENLGSVRLFRGVPRAGARFVGFNRNGWHVWATTCRVVEADAPARFVFDSGVPGVPIARWSYTIEGTADGGSEVTQSWDDLREDDRAGAIGRWLGKVFAGTRPEQRVQVNNAAIHDSLARLAAELGSGSPRS